MSENREFTFMMSAKISHEFYRLFLRRIFMPLFRTRTRVVVFVLASILSAVAIFASENASTQDDMDRSIKPGDDFYRYANGGWLETVVVPAGRTSYDTRTILT